MKKWQIENSGKSEISEKLFRAFDFVLQPKSCKKISEVSKISEISEFSPWPTKCYKVSKFLGKNDVAKSLLCHETNFC